MAAITKYARVAAGVALTLLFLWLALRNVDGAAVWDALRHARYAFLIPAGLSSLLGYAVRTVRWGEILRPTKRVRFTRLFPVLMVGFATNNLVPARVGEFARAYVLGVREQISRSLALATIVVERVCDGLTLLVLMTLALVLFPLPVDDPKLRMVELSATAIFGLATLVLAGLLLFPARFIAVARTVLRPMPRGLATRIETLLESFVRGLGALRSPRQLARIAGLSLLVWMLEGGSYAFMLLAFPFGLSTTARVAAAIFLLVFVNLGIMIPAAPGYIGTYQFFATLALGAFGVAPALAFGLAIVSHALQYVLVTSIGLLAFWHLGLTPGRIGALRPSAPSLTAAPVGRMEVAD